MRSKRAGQMDLFQARLDAMPLFKSALAEAMKRSHLSRDEIADRINGLLKREGLRGDVNAQKLSKWASPSDTTHAPSLRHLPFLLKAVDDASPLDALLAPLGLRICGEREQRLIELAEGRIAAKRAAQQIKLAEKALEEM